MNRYRGAEDAAPDSGDSYLAAASDLMAGLLFFFLITLAVFALRLEQTRADKQKQVDTWGGLDKTRQKILGDVKDRLADLGLVVEIDAEQGILRLSDQGIYFPSGRAQPEPEFLPNVGKVAAALIEVLPCYVARDEFVAGDVPSRPFWCNRETQQAVRDCTVEDYPWKVETLLIEGHTDSVPIAHSRKEFRDNLALSAARASEVLRLIRACEPGIDGLLNHSDQPIVSVSGYAETRPADRLNTESERNRRIDLRFIMEPPASLLEDEKVNVREPQPATRVRGELLQ